MRWSHAVANHSRDAQKATYNGVVLVGLARSGAEWQSLADAAFAFIFIWLLAVNSDLLTVSSRNFSISLPLKRARDESEMGRRLRRCCTGMGKPAVMKARTRAVRRLCLAAAEGRRSSKRLPSGDPRNSHIALHRRSVILRPQIEKSMENSGRRSKLSAEFGRSSRCSSDASCEVSPARSMSSEIGQECDTALSLRGDGERRETTGSNNLRDEASDVESTVETESCTRSRASKTPSNAELEQFFAAAERDQLQRFAVRYNFDIINDAPLHGRYEWIPLTP